MNSSISIPKRTLLLLSFLFFFITSSSFAQTVGGIDPNDLSNVRIDELTDEQVLSIIKQGESAGLTIEQAQSMAVKRGLPTSEVQKLKDRIAKIQSQSKLNSSRNNPNVQDSIMHLNNKELNEKNEPEEDFQDSLKVKKVVKSTIYGQDFFRNGDIKIFDKSTDAKAPANYVIGIGDELGVSVFGFSYYNEVLKVDSRGAINPSQMGPIFIKGLTYDRAKLLIRSKMGQYFDLSNNKLEITLAYSRSITVNIVGEVMKPGSYKIPALNTAFNALILAGGPSDIGTLREIQIKRDGKTIRTLDIYAFLNNPNAKQDFFLEDNDYILVKSSKKVVSISGEIKKPSSYELLETENLSDLLNYSGGLNAAAYKERIQIRRQSAKELQIIDLNLDSLQKIKKDFKLLNGDAVTIRANKTDLLNKVTINGAVNFPGEYNFTNGIKLWDLITYAGGLKTESELENAYIVRTKPDQTKEYIKININDLSKNPNSAQNILLNTLDELNIYSKKDAINNYKVSVYGSVKLNKEIDYIPGMTLGDAIRQAGGFRVNAENLRIEVSRLNYFTVDYIDGQEVKVIVDRIQLSDKTTNLDENQANYSLQPYDQIFVRAVPNFDAQKLVEIKGEVKYPGVYPMISKDEKVSSLIKRAGGLNKFAFAEGATFYRPELTGGFIVFKLVDVLKSDNSKYNFTLKRGDIITIPTVTDFVAIKGSSIQYLEVLNKDQVNAPFVHGRRAKYYIKTFGNGFTKDAWRKKTYVVQPNAKINRTRNFLIFNRYPKVTKGSTIYVVEKMKKEKQLRKEQEPFNWNKFIENTSLKLTGIATIFILFRQL